MAEKIHIKILKKDYERLRALAYRKNVSCSTVTDVVGIYYSKYGLNNKIDFNTFTKEDVKETVFKIRTENNPYMNQVKSRMDYYSTALYYYFNNNQVETEKRKDLKQLNIKIAKELEKKHDPNALYNAVVRMNYRAKKEKHKCKK